MTTEDESYPKRLKRLASPPRVLHLAGNWEHDGPIVAIVGSRDATGDGIDFTEALAAELARADAAIVSGLARGIDAAAHRGALGAGGRTGAVLGTGLDQCYPRGHEALQDSVRSSLGLMSELMPGTRARPGTFAARNRIVAALSDVVVVVQGQEASGALITAEEARRIGVPVGAVPWDPREPLSAAPNELIRAHGAVLVRGADDVLALAGAIDSPSSARSTAVPSGAMDRPPRRTKLSDPEARAFAALRTRAQSLDQVAERAGLSAAAAGAALLALELAGLARREPGAMYRRSGGR